jgi:hypothetical protein
MEKIIKDGKKIPANGGIYHGNMEILFRIIMDKWKKNDHFQYKSP